MTAITTIAKPPCLRSTPRRPPFVNLPGADETGRPNPGRKVVGVVDCPRSRPKRKTQTAPSGRLSPKHPNERGIYRTALMPASWRADQTTTAMLQIPTRAKFPSPVCSMQTRLQRFVLLSGARACRKKPPSAARSLAVISPVRKTSLGRKEECAQGAESEHQVNLFLYRLRHPASGSLKLCRTRERTSPRIRSCFAYLQRRALPILHEAPGASLPRRRVRGPPRLRY